MAFETGSFREMGEDRQKPGRLLPAAVKCWFTSRGRAMPLTAKVRDKEGAILSLGPIRIKNTWRRRYAGIPAWEYECGILEEGRERVFSLFFYPESCEWKLRAAGNMTENS